MNIINWFITPKHHILKGDVVLSASEFMERNNNLSKNKKKQRIDLSGLIYEYKELGKIHKSFQEDKNYTIITRNGQQFILNWNYMDKYFMDNHLKSTQEYLKGLETSKIEYLKTLESLKVKI
uniref:Uncharacterized protein n=1 Tax=viral metagenome TaxID=1070528 RepID=A0A6C0JHL3_9ZZZZ